ncbi:MAG: hypothetical protein ABWW65_02425 [Thermoprotei archaeon]
MAKVLVIVSTSEIDKAVLGVLWATYALREKLVEDVELVFFGPIEEKIAIGDKKLMRAIEEFRKLGKTPVACRIVAKTQGYLEMLADKIKVGDVGRMIAEYINNGYIPLVF